MDRFLKRKEHLVSPVLPDPKKPKVYFKQGAIFASFWAQEFGLSFYESGGKLFCKSSNLVIEHHRKFVIKRHIDYKV